MDIIEELLAAFPATMRPEPKPVPRRGRGRPRKTGHGRHSERDWYLERLVKGGMAARRKYYDALLVAGLVWGVSPDVARRAYAGNGKSRTTPTRNVDDRLAGIELNVSPLVRRAFAEDPDASAFDAPPEPIEVMEPIIARYRHMLSR